MSSREARAARGSKINVRNKRKLIGSTLIPAVSFLLINIIVIKSFLSGTLTLQSAMVTDMRMAVKAKSNSPPIHYTFRIDRQWRLQVHGMSLKMKNKNK